MSTSTKHTPEQLAVKIQCELDASRKAVVTSVKHALEAGRLLIEAKATVGHGSFGKWLKANFELTERQAQKYMRLYQNRYKLNESNPNWSSEMSITESLHEISRLLRDENESKSKSDSSDETDAEAEQMKHEARVAELGRLTNKRRLRHADQPMLNAVESDMTAFVDDFVTLAKRHATHICKSLSAERMDKKVVAMLLAKKLLMSLDPKEAFKPVAAKSAA